ncbi:transporter substrate-binding domain-containing protein [Mesorhizobium sp. B2-2-3]|nr:transporter substrate-binding domain-containing protein [Mesorhizobium sp. B2-5-3]TPM05060.1 transporter substrate-binding domain-containing protein [Mesorhizobium sp. B2-3-8]TPM13328.1 transporter substrate-binding domain-containing protein [Mesorhizobium sp. B2-3-7]TPM43532.1 transporter substrate-binding domain-containing protein [Mesorhizobium sp. B2-2-3]
MMKKLVLVLAAGLAAFATQVSARDLRVGSECTYPPFNYKDANGELRGFDIDVAKEVVKRLGADASFVCMPFDSLIPGLVAGKFDLLAASMSITDERKKSIDFSIPYRSSTARFVGPDGSDAKPLTDDGKPNPDGLKGKTIGIERASTYENYMRDNFPEATIQLYDTADNMLLDLTSKRTDLVFAGPIKLANDFLNKDRGKGYKFIGPEIKDVKYFGPGVGIGMRKDDAGLRDELDKAMKAMIDDGTFKTINDKYWSFSVLPASN